MNITKVKGACGRTGFVWRGLGPEDIALIKNALACYLGYNRTNKWEKEIYYRLVKTIKGAAGEG